ncbi:hypothetical protein BD309DRAFT_953837 [Dichomitus squalens]|nr:hypothetical protein BD309DRAFT_953837 [Dichomitus squalens]
MMPSQRRGTSHGLTKGPSVSRERRSSRHRLRRPKGLTRQGGATAQVRQPHLTYNPKTPWHRKC